MVAKDSAATVIYNDGCEQKFDKVGTYKIEPNCKVAVAFFEGGRAALIAAAVIGGVVVAMVVDDNDQGKPRPISR